MFNWSNIATKRSEKYLDDQKKRTKKPHKKSKKNKKSKHKEITSESEEGILLLAIDNINLWITLNQIV